MEWEPDHHGWMAYIKFELRGGEVGRARNIYERYVACIPSTKGWVRFAKFEAENGDLGRSRLVYERALQVRLLAVSASETGCYSDSGIAQPRPVLKITQHSHSMCIHVGAGGGG